LPAAEARSGAGAEDLALLVAAAREAGALAMSYFRRDPRTWTKAADSLVSEADVAVDRMLAERLGAARPDYGWLSEEIADSAERLSRRRVFVVDPIDGTRAFVAGRSEWAVSIAVVESGRPIAAALFAPALDEMFQAAAGAGAERNGVPLHVAALEGLAGARFAGPRRYARQAAEAAGVDVADIRFVPSLAYRIALVAAGEVDVAISGPNADDWDLAAADLLVHEAGGRLIGFTGEPVRYNGADPRHPALIAAAPRLSELVLGLIAEGDRDAIQPTNSDGRVTI
jgi:myo-inositol-1(or 4)-monophosphatase